MEQMAESGWHETSPPVSFPSATETDQIRELRQQITHWKSMAERGGDGETKETIREMEKRIESLRQQKEHEIQTIVESHAEAMVEMREMYEEKLSAMQVRMGILKRFRWEICSFLSEKSTFLEIFGSGHRKFQEKSVFFQKCKSMI